MTNPQIVKQLKRLHALKASVRLDAEVALLRTRSNKRVAPLQASLSPGRRRQTDIFGRRGADVRRYGAIPENR